MREAVICEPVRTPVGRFGGVFRDLPVTALAATVVTELLRRTGIPSGAIEDVLFGQCYPNGEAPALGRIAALDAGLPVEVPGLQLVEFYSAAMRWGVTGSGVELHDRLARARATAGGVFHPMDGGMLETAENLRREYGIPRAEQDELALASHRRAVAATEDGRFAEEIVPVTVPGRRGKPDTVVDRDEHPRADTSLESLAELKPVRLRLDPDSTVTAGNASGQNDGAAVCVVTTMDKAGEYGLRPLARLVSWAVAGVGPATMGIGPVPATERALARADLTLADIDLIELNEAFAAQVLAVTREWKFTAADFERTNVNGSGISLGHPVGATGARILATLLRELDRRGGRYGLETMCIGGGQGLAAVFERMV
jgi:acetyl-CoA C-acetyltransferase